MADARSFNLQLDDWIRNEVPKVAANLQKQIVAECLGSIVQMTPVGNATKWKRNVERAAKGKPPLPRGYVGGQARRNWQVSIGLPARTPLAGTDPSGRKAESDGYAVIGRITEPTRVWISNPLDYMDALENGWSRQAPTGMVANAVALVSAKYGRVR